MLVNGTHADVEITVRIMSSRGQARLTFMFAAVTCVCTTSSVEFCRKSVARVWISVQ